MARSTTVAILLLAALGCAPHAEAHLMVANKGAVTITDHNASVAISVPVAALSGFDDNGDALIDVGELGRHAGALASQIAGRLRVTADGAGPVEGMTLVASAQTSEDAELPIDYVVAMSIQRFESRPRVVEIWTDLFGATDKDKRIAFTASRDQVEEVAELTPDRPSHRFFRGNLSVFVDFLATGAAHILLGYDHLLFLLTIIVAALTARQWILVITAFTLAHAVTLTAAGFGLVSAPAAVVEPLIAASIVGLAIDNLMGGGRRPFRLRVAIVFACGLLHGLGFATALLDFGLTRANIVASLAGFNLGVEFGQMLFLAAVGATLWLVSLTNFAPSRQRLVAAASIFAGVPGLALLVTRALQAA